MEEEKDIILDEEQEEDINKFGIFPAKVANALENIEKVFGVDFEVREELPRLNRGGYAYSKGNGLSYGYCTSSYLDGPGYDYSKEFDIMLEGLGFEKINSYGDNGMDSATNWQDTFWDYDYIYKPSEKPLYDDKEIDRLSQPIFSEDDYMDW